MDIATRGEYDHVKSVLTGYEKNFPQELEYFLGQSKILDAFLIPNLIKRPDYVLKEDSIAYLEKKFIRYWA